MGARRVRSKGAQIEVSGGVSTEARGRRHAAEEPESARGRFGRTKRVRRRKGAMRARDGEHAAARAAPRPARGGAARRARSSHLQRDREELGVSLDVLLLAGGGAEAEALEGVLDMGRVDVHVAVLG